MATTLESLEELTSWDSYRTFMKERLKQLPDGTECPIYVSKKKLDFDMEGKSWNGYAVLVGEKCEPAVRKIRQDGVQFEEGTCRSAGKDLEVSELSPTLLRSAQLTLKKLHLGWSIAGVDAGEDEAPEKPQRAVEPDVQKRLANLLAGIKKNTVMADMEPGLGAFLEQATARAKEAEKLLEASDAEGARALLEEGEEFLQQAIVGVLEGGEPTEAEQIETRRAELLDEIKEAAALRSPGTEDALKQAATLARDVINAVGKRDYRRASTQLDEIEGLLSEIDEDPESGADGDPDLAGLDDWKAYRKFLRANLKLLPAEGGPFYVSRKKVEFTVKGKPYKGFAVLLGKKARHTVQALKAKGTLFQEGTCQREGKNLVVHEISTERFKGAARTFAKLRLGRKLVAGRVAGEDEPAVAGATREGFANEAGTGAGTTAPPKLSKKLLLKVQEVANALVKLREAADALKKAGLRDQPYRGDFDKLTNALGAIAQSADPEKDKEAQLKKLKTTATEKTLDAKVAGLDPRDEKTGPLIAKQIEARFGVKLKLSEGIEVGVDKKTGRSKYKDYKRDPKMEAATLKELYQTMSKVPVFPASHLKKIEVSLRASTSRGEGGVYYEDDKKAAITCKRPKDSLNYGDELADRGFFPDGVDDNCKPANSKPVNYFNWATLHEVAHAVDAKNKFMDGKGSQPSYGGWTEYGNNVAPIAKVVAQHFGTGLAGKDLSGLEAYATALMRNQDPKAANSPNEEAKRPAVKDWVDAVRVGQGLWWNGGESKNRAIGGIVYQEAYDFAGGWWNSYSLAARKRGIHGYQFRAPGEWFAELYAAHYSEKLKPSHPFVPDLKKLEAPSK